MLAIRQQRFSKHEQPRGKQPPNGLPHDENAGRLPGPSVGNHVVKEQGKPTHNSSRHNRDPMFQRNQKAAAEHQECGDRTGDHRPREIRPCPHGEAGGRANPKGRRCRVPVQIKRQGRAQKSEARHHRAHGSVVKRIHVQIRRMDRQHQRDRHSSRAASLLTDELRNTPNRDRAEYQRDQPDEPGPRTEQVKQRPAHTYSLMAPI